MSEPIDTTLLSERLFSQRAPVGVVQMEEHLLRWIVLAPRPHAHCPDKFVDQLGNYCFQSPNHQLLFDCLRPIAHRNMETIRELLPSFLVRAGFPDVEFEHLFHGEPISNEQALQLINQLVDCRNKVIRQTNSFEIGSTKKKPIKR